VEGVQRGDQVTGWTGEQVSMSAQNKNIADTVQDPKSEPNMGKIKN